MALNFTYSNGFTQKPTGTLGTSDMFYKPAVPAQSQATNINGTDGRAYTREVGRNELAVNHLNDMTAGNSKYIQNARQRGLEAAARRGMMNSSISAGNAERAAIEAASPFAMQSADAYGRAQTENLGYLNENLLQERDIGNKVLMERLQAEGMAGAGRDAVAAAELEAQNRYRMFQEGLAFDGEQRGLDRAHDFGLSDMGYRQQRGLNEQGYGFDIGRAEHGYQWQSREADRNVHRDIARTDNLYSNQRYNTAFEARLANAQSAIDWARQVMFNDPTTRPQDVDGAVQFQNRLGTQLIDDSIDRNWPGDY